MTLPTDQKMFLCMKNFETDGINWNNLLDGRNTFQLLYSLQIVESLVNTEFEMVCFKIEFIYFFYFKTKKNSQSTLIV